MGKTCIAVRRKLPSFNDSGWWLTIVFLSCFCITVAGHDEEAFHKLRTSRSRMYSFPTTATTATTTYHDGGHDEEEPGTLQRDLVLGQSNSGYGKKVSRAPTTRTWSSTATSSAPFPTTTSSTSSSRGSSSSSSSSSKPPTPAPTVLATTTRPVSRPSKARKTNEPTPLPTKFSSKTALPTTAPTNMPSHRVVASSSRQEGGGFDPKSLAWSLLIPFASVSCFVWAMRKKPNNDNQQQGKMGSRIMPEMRDPVPHEILVPQKSRTLSYRSCPDDVELVSASTWKTAEDCYGSSSNDDEGLGASDLSSDYIVMKS